jgi:hypothetical protein
MSSIASNSEDLILNADGGSSTVKFKIDGTEKASISSAGAFTSTTIDATKLTGNLPAISAASLTNIPAANITGTLPAISGASLTNLPEQGITEADMWRMHTQTTGDLIPITSNLERVDTDSFEKIGTGMTQSSGIFTFPSTGKWLIQFQAAYYMDTSSTSRYCRSKIEVTTDNSSYSAASLSTCWMEYIAPQTDASTFCQCIFDVTNVSTHKVKFLMDVFNTATTCWGDTNSNHVAMTFIKLGDT